MTRGAAGPYFLYPAILEDLNLLKELEVRYYRQIQQYCMVYNCMLYVSVKLYRICLHINQGSS